MKRKTYSNAFKFKVALATLKADKTITEICQHFEVAPSMVHKWKKELQDNGANLFEGVKKKHNSRQAEQENDMKISKLYEKVGQLTIERDFLKKSWEKYQGNDD
jgi:transposase